MRERRRVQHHNWHFSRQWPCYSFWHLFPRCFGGWSAGRLTFTMGLTWLIWCVSLSLHFYERDKSVNRYWINAIENS